MLPEIGLQATQLMSDSTEPLYTLALLSQNFPKYATSIARRVVVNNSLEEEVNNNQIKAQPGVNVLWLNGATVAEKDVNPFACVWPFFNAILPELMICGFMVL
jgi:UDP-glucose:glycoprotein glucosyltransferase